MPRAGCFLQGRLTYGLGKSVGDLMKRRKNQIFKITLSLNSSRAAQFLRNMIFSKVLNTFAINLKGALIFFNSFTDFFLLKVNDLGSQTRIEGT